MSGSGSYGCEPVRANLRKALESLRNDIDRAEFWAGALEGLTHPVLDYQASDRLSHHLLPPRSAARAKADH